METSMTEKMQMLPLLQGLTLQDFNELIVNMKLDFRQHDEGDTIANQGDRCNMLVYIIGGTFEAEYHDTKRALIISETCNDTPHLIEPYNLFGVKRTYERTYTFATEGATFCISREFFMAKMLANPIIRSNYINFLCNELRKSYTQLQTNHHNDIEHKMIAALQSYCLFPKGEKTMRMTMNDLAYMIDETRLNVSNTLNKWKDDDLIELRRFGFTIKDMAVLNDKKHLLNTATKANRR